MSLLKEAVVSSLSIMSSQVQKVGATNAVGWRTQPKRTGDWLLSTKLLSVKLRRAQLASDFYDYVCRYIRALGCQADRLGARHLVEAIGLFLSALKNEISHFTPVSSLMRLTRSTSSFVTSSSSAKFRSIRKRGIEPSFRVVVSGETFLAVGPCVVAAARWKRRPLGDRMRWIFRLSIGLVL